MRPTIGWNNVEESVENCIPMKYLFGGNFSYASALFGLAAMHQPKVVVEIGTQYGISTRVWLAATNAEVHSIDIDESCAKLVDTFQEDWKERWTFHHGRSQDISLVQSGWTDLLYVDGDHSYEAVVSDMKRYGPSVRSGGLVILDDYHVSWPGKMRWVDERWEVLDPFLIGPAAVFRMADAKRKACTG